MFAFAQIERIVFDGDKPADGKPADDDIARADKVEQAGKIGDMVRDRIGRRAEPGQAMAAHVVAEGGEVHGELVNDLAPDAEVGAERIGEDDQRFSRPANPVFVMKRDAANVGELHPGSSLSSS